MANILEGPHRCGLSGYQLRSLAANGSNLSVKLI
jgi:hypothetical protein